MSAYEGGLFAHDGTLRDDALPRFRADTKSSVGTVSEPRFAST
jgi:hypothetical protein